MDASVIFAPYLTLMEALLAVPRILWGPSVRLVEQLSLPPHGELFLGHPGLKYLNKYWIYIMKNV